MAQVHAFLVFSKLQAEDESLAVSVREEVFDTAGSIDLMALVFCTGADPTLMKTRRLILERAGHRVVSAMDEQEVTVAFKYNHSEVAVIGQSISPEVNRLIAKLVHQYCPSAKILELFPRYQSRTLGDADSWLEVPSSAPKDLADQVTKLAQGTRLSGLTTITYWHRPR